MGRKSETPRAPSLREKVDGVIACGGATARTIRRKTGALSCQWKSQCMSAYTLAEQRWEAAMPCRLQSALLSALGVYLLFFGMSLCTLLVLIEAVRFSGVVDKLCGFCGEPVVTPVKQPKSLGSTIITPPKSPESTIITPPKSPESTIITPPKESENVEESEANSPAKEPTAASPIKETPKKPNAESQPLCARLHAACHQTDATPVIEMCQTVFLSCVFVIAALKFQLIRAILLGMRVSAAFASTADGAVTQRLTAVISAAVGEHFPKCFVYPRVLLTAFFVTIGLLLPTFLRALFTALIGAELILTHGCAVLAAFRRGAIRDQCASALVPLTFCGAVWQLRHPGALPLVLRIFVLLPLAAERLVQWLIQNVN